MYLLLLTVFGCAPETNTFQGWEAQVKAHSGDTGGSDFDGDGYSSSDCNDNDASIHPGATELCDATDQDCDGLADNGACSNCTSSNDGQHDFLVCTNAISWSSAQSACAAIGYHLADVEDSAENTSIYAAAQAVRSGNAWWLGINDLANEGVYTWDGGSTSSYSNWRSGEPNNFNNNEDCGKYAANYAGQWNDSNCADTNYYICEAGCVLIDTFTDADGDGYGDTNSRVRACSPAAGMVSVGGDCDDTDAAISPAATEICGGGDEDCDGLIDDADPNRALGGTSIWHRDADGDGHGVSSNSRYCTQPTGYVSSNDDCDDSSATIYPGATEVPLDGIDQDCDGTDSCLWYDDQDGDGYGDPNVPSADCTYVAGYVRDSSDCDDGDAQIHPGQTEIYHDGIDTNCDGQSDDDADGDGIDDTNYGGTDCNDADTQVYPGAPETCDATDQDCDGLADNGACSNCTSVSDGQHDFLICTQALSWSDAQAACQGMGYHLVDLEDTVENSAVFSEAEIVRAGSAWWIGLNDSATEGSYAWDGGSTSSFRNWRTGEPNNFNNSEDCGKYAAGYAGQWNDANCTDANTYICEAGCLIVDAFLDVDQDGYGDPATLSRSCTPAAGTVSLGGDCDDTDPFLSPGATETCGGGDEDCDGLVDDADPDRSLQGTANWYADQDGDGHGAGSVQAACSQPYAYVALNDDCDDSQSSVYPGAPEIRLDGIDQDCNGSDSCLWYADQDNDGYGDSLTPSPDCNYIAGYVENAADCNDNDALINPLTPETYHDGIDANCDGQSDDDVDGDGLDDINYGGTDCNDNDPLIAPGAPESCDGIDQNCDNEIDEGDVCPCTRGSYGQHSYLFCADNDVSWGEANVACAALGYHQISIEESLENAYIWSTAETTDPASAWWIGLSDVATEGSFAWADGVYLGYTNWRSGEPNDFNSNEDCGKYVDNSEGYWNDGDCAGPLPYICEAGCLTIVSYIDSDGDGYGDMSSPAQDCELPEGRVVQGGDCDDSDPTISPDAFEVCGGGDEDCDGLIDDADDSVDPAGMIACYPDGDADGYGTASGDILACSPPEGYAAAEGDCNDRDAATNPGMPEAIDGLDNDCDGYTETEDADGDGLSQLIEDAIGSDPHNPDTDGDSLPDGQEVSLDGSSVLDTDSDGAPNWNDTDDDGDGISTLIECGDDDIFTLPPDTDRDGQADPVDTDSDGDSVWDGIEGGLDSDQDGLEDRLDTDDDGDSIDSLLEATVDIDGDGGADFDVDEDGQPNYLDLDSDGDGCPDQAEGTADNNQDSLPDYVDSQCGDKVAGPDCGCNGVSAPMGGALLSLAWLRRRRPRKEANRL